MEVNIEFLFTFRDDNVEWNIQKEVWNVTRKLKKYDTGITFIFERIYKIEQNNEIYRQACEVYKKYPNDVTFERLKVDTILTEKEQEDAVAFVVNGTRSYCVQYYDIGYEYQQCSKCGMERRSEEDFFVKPEGYLKRKQSDYGVAELDGLYEKVLTVPLKNELVEQGIEERFFQPVYTKRKKVVGYVFTSDHVLPKGSYMDATYRMKSICSKCGAVSYIEDDKKNIIEAPVLNQMGVMNLQDVSYTYEFYEGRQIILISPKIQKILKRCTKDVDFIPVYSREKNRQ